MTHIRIFLLLPLVGTTILMSGCQSSIESTPKPIANPVTATQPEATATQEETVTPSHTPASAPDGTILYTTQSGDTLSWIATRFGARPSEIEAVQNVPLPPSGLLSPGIELRIPQRIKEFSSPNKLLPDSEVVFSVSASDFDIGGYLTEQNGYLTRHLDSALNAIPLTGAELIEKVAIENSVNPRLLLALLEWQCGCVTGDLPEHIDPEYLAQINQWQFRGLYRQLMWLIDKLNQGYYGWRGGQITEFKFNDGTSIRINPTLNAGTVAIQSVLASLAEDQQAWHAAIDPDAGFYNLYLQLLDDPWARAAELGPLYPKNLTQPTLTLPFEPGKTWSYTGGPHTAWEKYGPEAAIDLTPRSEKVTCDPSEDWVLAPADGIIARLEPGILVLDLDGDGDEHTGWVLVFVHLTADFKIEQGQLVERDTKLGHPSCEGGPSSSSHLHLARRYNGEWMLAGGPVPLNLGGWVVGDLPEYYKGTITKDNITLTSCTCATANTYIKRPKNP